MTNAVFLIVFAVVALCAINTNVNGFKTTNFDLEAAASGKQHEWKKGSEEDHFFEEHDKKGEKGEKGYKGEHE